MPGVVLLDADIFAFDHVSVVSPNQDYPAFWRSMMRLAHELSQNGVVVVYFSGMLPDQLLANRGALGYFDSVHFCCLSGSAELLHVRLAHREPETVPERMHFWCEFNDSLVAAAREIPTASLIDADGDISQVEQEVRRWIEDRL